MDPTDIPQRSHSHPTHIQLSQEKVDELRKRIKFAQHLISVKQEELPKLKERLMWALFDQLSDRSKEKFMAIYDSMPKAKRRHSREVSQLTALIERTLEADKRKTLEGSDDPGIIT